MDSEKIDLLKTQIIRSFFGHCFASKEFYKILSMASVHENAISQTLIFKFSLLRKFRAGARWAPKSAPSNFIFQKIFTELYCYFLENVTFRIFQQILSKPDHFGVSWGLSCMQPVCVPCIEMTESIRFRKFFEDALFYRQIRRCLNTRDRFWLRDAFPKRT